jgi:hypothetical protein
MAKTKTPPGILIASGALAFALIGVAVIVTIYNPPGEGWERLSNWLLAGIAILFVVTVLRRKNAPKD